HGQMLQRSSVEDQFGLTIVEDVVDHVGVADVRQDDIPVVQESVPRDTQLRDLKACCVTVEHHQLSRAELRQLAAQFRSDGSAGTRDEHALAGDVAGDQLDVRIDGMPDDQVFDADI